MQGDFLCACNVEIFLEKQADKQMDAETNRQTQNSQPCRQSSKQTDYGEAELDRQGKWERDPERQGETFPAMSELLDVTLLL